ncbi:MAG: WYL domain-containing protein [Caldilineaceae bacterium]
MLEPLGLVAKGNTWYLVAVFKGNNAVYRVSRIFNACLLDEPCERPKHFDLAAFWAESSAQFFAKLPRYPVEVLAQAEIVESLRCWRRAGNVERVSPPEADGRQRVTLIFESETEACAQCLSFGPQLEVLTPYHLRQQVIEQAKATVAQYAHQMVAPHHRKLAA